MSTASTRDLAARAPRTTYLAYTEGVTFDDPATVKAWWDAVASSSPAPEPAKSAWDELTDSSEPLARAS